MTTSMSHPEQSDSLIALSYAFQKSRVYVQGSQVNLLITGAASPIPSGKKAICQWGVVTAGKPTLAQLELLSAAFSLASIDQASRSLLTSAGEHLSTKILAAQKLTQQMFQHGDPVLGQIKSLENVFADPSASRIKPDETLRDTQSQLARHTDKQNTIDTDVISGLEQTYSTEEIKDLGHLVILASDAQESISPSIVINDLIHFTSITVLFDGDVSYCLSWKRWATLVGASLMGVGSSSLEVLADRFQQASLGMRRHVVSLVVNEQYSILSATTLTPSAGPLALDTMQGRSSVNSVSIWAEFPVSQERWSVTLTLKSRSQKLEESDRDDLSIGTLRCRGITEPISLEADFSSLHPCRHLHQLAQKSYIASPLTGGLPPAYDQLMLGTAFGQQLSHRIRVIDNLILSLLKREMRRSAKLLDQLVKISLTLGDSKGVKQFRGLKLKLLALGDLGKPDWAVIIDALLKPSHTLNLSGYWQLNKRGDE